VVGEKPEVQGQRKATTKPESMLTCDWIESIHTSQNAGLESLG
jgi:hypothetical protein